MPAPGTEEGWCQDPMAIARDHPLVTAVAEGIAWRRAPTRSSAAGAASGNVGDGNIIGAAGIPSLQYGAGDIRTYKEWPTPDERVKLSDLITAARAIAYATYRLCG